MLSSQYYLKHSTTIARSVSHNYQTEMCLSRSSTLPSGCNLRYGMRTVFQCTCLSLLCSACLPAPGTFDYQESWKRHWHGLSSFYCGSGRVVGDTGLQWWCMLSGPAVKGVYSKATLIIGLLHSLITLLCTSSHLATVLVRQFIACRQTASRHRHLHHPLVSFKCDLPPKTTHSSTAHAQLERKRLVH